MDNFFYGVKKSWVLSSILTIALGVVLLIYPDTTSRVLGYTVGAVLIVRGLLDLWRYFTDETGRHMMHQELIVGIVLCGAGIFLLMRPGIVVSIIPVILGLYILIDGLINVRRALDLRNMGMGKWWSALVAAILMALLGAVILWNPFATAQITIMFMGGVLLYQGLSDLVILIFSKKGTHDMKKRFRQK